MTPQDFNIGDRFKIKSRAYKSWDRFKVLSGNGSVGTIHFSDKSLKYYSDKVIFLNGAK
jgi:hypothetical protein